MNNDCVCKLLKGNTKQHTFNKAIMDTSELHPDLPPLPPKPSFQPAKSSQFSKEYPVPTDLQYLSNKHLDSFLGNTARIQQYVHEINVVDGISYQELENYKNMLTDLLLNFEQLYEKKDRLETLHYETKNAYNLLVEKKEALDKLIHDRLSIQSYQRRVEKHSKELRDKSDKLGELLLKEYSEEAIDEYFAARIEYHDEYQKYECFK